MFFIIFVFLYKNNFRLGFLYRVNEGGKMNEGSVEKSKADCLVRFVHQRSKEEKESFNEIWIQLRLVFYLLLTTAFDQIKSNWEAKWSIVHVKTSIKLGFLSVVDINEEIKCSGVCTLHCSELLKRTNSNFKTGALLRIVLFTSSAFQVCSKLWWLGLFLISTWLPD